MIEQGTEEWLAERVGHMTASRTDDATATVKSGVAASVEKYAAELVCERLTGEPYPCFQSPAMRWGTETEPLARATYEDRMGCMIESAGFVKHPTIEWYGASPDGLVLADGLVEFKCPDTHTHIRYLMAARKAEDKASIIPGGYQKQMLSQLACTKRKWCDWVSYDPRMPEHLRMLVIHFQPDQKAIAAIEGEAKAFLAYVQRIYDELTDQPTKEK